MSLNWDLSGIAAVDVTCWEAAEMDEPARGRRRGEKYLTPVTEALIFATMAVGLGKIEAKNIGEWRARFAVMAKLGVFMLSGGEGKPERWNPSHEDIRKHVGLRTNATTETRAAWGKRVMEGLFRDAERGLVSENAARVEAETDRKRRAGQ